MREENVITIMEPKSPSIPRSKSDLENLNAGDLVRVTHSKPYRNWDTYEGVIDGKDAFILQDGRDATIINSFRVSRINLKFDGYFGVVMPETGVEMIQYLEGDKNYESRRGMLIANKHWRKE